MSKLRFRNGPYLGREITLDKDPLTIGRDADATVQILDRSASRVHSEIFPVGGMYFVRDRDSKNGTLVNDQKILDEELLREGDVVKIGSTELVFESGIALNDTNIGERIAYDDHEDLGNTIEFRVDDLSDIEEGTESEKSDDRGLRTLYQMSKLLSNTNSSDTCLDALKFIVEALPAEFAVAFMRQGSGSKLVPRGMHSANDWSKPTIARSIIKKTLSEHRAVLTENAQDDDRFSRQQSVSDNDIRSVICVPITIKGITRGVLYVSRSGSNDPFTHDHLELLSACAIQFGMYFQNIEASRSQHKVLWSALCSLVSCIELGSGHEGRGERCAKIAQAIGIKLSLSEKSRFSTQAACLLLHIGEISAHNDTNALDKRLEILEDSSAFKTVTPLIRDGWERLDGSGPLAKTDKDLDVEARLTAVAAAFEELGRLEPELDNTAIIERMKDSGGFDPELCNALAEVLLDGSLTL